jgi:hypothetical protein
VKAVVNDLRRQVAQRSGAAFDLDGRFWCDTADNSWDPLIGCHLRCGTTNLRYSSWRAMRG